MKTGWSVAISGPSTKFTEEFIPSIRNPTTANPIPFLFMNRARNGAKNGPESIHLLPCFSFA